MTFITTIQNAITQLNLPPLLLIGFMIGTAFFFGKWMKFIKLPSIIGFMVIGVLLGPSLFNLLNEKFQEELGFISDIALSFVAVSIGLELVLHSLKKLGRGIGIVIFSESFAAFFLVTLGVFLLTRDLPLALIFGSIAPASAPAGTVAIIQEYKARGPLTRALYAVVGFDDGLGIIIFGFASAIARALLSTEMGGESMQWYILLLDPLKEVLLSMGIGTIIAFLFCLLGRKLSGSRDTFILLFAFILLSAGLCHIFHLSLILTNMILGFVIVNTQKKSLTEKIHHDLMDFMPLLFILFFVLAGANLHISALPSLGLLGIIYSLCRGLGLVSGAAFGARIGKLESNIQKYLGMGILSQAGVAIGLSLIVKKEFLELGAHGKEIGSTVITTITATCIFFEILGPILTKIGLEKAGEIQPVRKS